MNTKNNQIYSSTVNTYNKNINENNIIKNDNKILENNIYEDNNIINDNNVLIDNNIKKNKIQTKKTFKNIFCGNCGKFGHIYKKCTDHIISLGIIAYRFNNNNNREYLMVQRKDTLAYVEIIRGKYDIDDMELLKTLFNEMTMNEKSNMLNNDNKFEKLWNNIWNYPNFKSYKNDYIIAKKKFNILKNGYINSSNYYVSLEIFINNSNSLWNEPEWGFPKGRRNVGESNIFCAMREFNEETNYTNMDFDMLYNVEPFIESFKGSNNIYYKHIYYLCKFNNLKEPFIQYDNKYQINEISNISWFTLKNVIKKIRNYNKEKICIIKKIDDFLNDLNL